MDPIKVQINGRSLLDAVDELAFKIADRFRVPVKRIGLHQVQPRKNPIFLFTVFAADDKVGSITKVNGMVMFLPFEKKEI